MADNVNVAAELDKLQNMFEAAKPASNGVPDGNYEACISEMGVKVATTGNIQCVTKFVIQTEGDYFEKTVDVRHNIGNEQGVSYFKSFCFAIGMELPSRFSDLQAACNDFVTSNKDIYKITTKIKNGFVNAYVNGKVL